MYNESTNLVGLPAADLDAILAKAEENQSRKATITAEQLRAVQERIAQLEAQNAQTSRRRGRPANPNQEPKETRADADISRPRPSWFTGWARPDRYSRQHDGVMEYNDMVAKCDLAFTVETKPTAVLKNGEWVEEPNSMAVVRADNSATMRMNVGADFTPIQNAQILEIATDLTREHGMSFESMGAWEGGKLAYTSLLAGSYGIAGNEHKRFITLTWAHSGKIAASIGVADFCVVCENTFARQIANTKADVEAGDRIKIRQTSDANEKIKAIRKQFRENAGKFDTIQQMFRAVASRKFAHSSEVQNAVLEILGLTESRIAEAKNARIANEKALVLRLIEESRKDVPAVLHNTMYEAANAVTRYANRATVVQVGEEKDVDAVYARNGFDGESSRKGADMFEYLLGLKNYTEIVVPQPVYSFAS